jgi:hypothetical protein
MLRRQVRDELIVHLAGFAAQFRPECDDTSSPKDFL